MDEDNTVRIFGKSLPVSTKHCIEISNFIRNKSFSLARAQLGLILEKKTALPLKKYNKDRGHKRGKMTAGCYPQKAIKEILNLLTSLEGYANNKGLDKTKLYIQEIIPNRASTSYHYGRIRGIQNKATHVEITAAERKQKKEEKKVEKQNKEIKVEEKKVEQKPKEKKE